MEFRSAIDVQIAEKMLQFPLLGEARDDAWNARFTAEFHMTNDSGLFHESPGKGRLPLYEGKMIWQFDHRLAQPRYWVNEKDGRKSLLGSRRDTGQTLDYQCYRFGFRDIASNTNERTSVATVIPPTIFMEIRFQRHGSSATTGSVLSRTTSSYTLRRLPIASCSIS